MISPLRNAKYIKGSALVFLLVWRINPLRFADIFGFCQKHSKLRLCTTA